VNSDSCVAKQRKRSETSLSQRELPPKGFTVAFVAKKNDDANTFTHSLAERITKKHSLSLERVRPSSNRSEELERLLKACRTRSRPKIIALDERGHALSSEDLASLVADAADDGFGSVGFLVGGALGLPHDMLHERVDVCVKLSEMRMSHEVARIVLLEQLQRVIALLRGEPYHS
jgi:23S rRNA (pseudouridine1915-N3)-methyltransferase